MSRTNPVDYIVVVLKGLGGAALSCAVSLVVGLSLLEIPFSLPFSIFICIAMVLIGFGTIFVVHTHAAAKAAAAAARSAHKAAASSGVGGGGAPPPPSRSADPCGVSCAEYTLAVFLAIMAVLAGSFALWIYFKSKDLAAEGRLAM